MALLLQRNKEDGGEGLHPVFIFSLITLFKNMSFPWKTEEWGIFAWNIFKN